MSFLEIVAVLIIRIALRGDLNGRYIGLPPSIGVALGGLAVSVVLTALGMSR